ncbi:hypothetical protein C427_3223 [Paraglaciecola psychrophila 170]|uniref:Uncharacterized protein n=1 Tax=Paraglaciecola psychrophila 170 TaxID=1129794 RepID=K7AFM6_9ALTE|nr:hypothetical protein C427_3223 [Paraglaciecola psychrophila 170]GAC39443.1 hypothetical protein GPSY_3832 [Paraglaciecola psychrophila 170]
MLPESTIVKLARVRLASRVVDVLNINEYGDFFQSKSLTINKLV